jgi:hypothetical protein
MDDLVVWLRAQLDEDAAVLVGEYEETTWHTKACESVPDVLYPGRETGACDCGVPARVLREIDAKRAVVDAYAQADAMSGASAVNYGAWVNNEPLPYPEEAEGTSEVKNRLPGLRHALRLLALPYADRPGYQETWRP